MSIPDWRYAYNSNHIPAEHYADQPYIIVADDGAWVCVLTTSGGEEGSGGQHIISMRSEDFGKNWTHITDVEPADGPEASYAVLLKSPSGRIFVFYNHNTDRVERVKADVPSGYYTRVDSLGHFVFKYSDDCGKSWSAERYDIPMRLFECDRENNDGGILLYFWNVGRAFVYDGRAYVPIIKVGRYGEGFFSRSEGALLVSGNLFGADDPADAVWSTYPDGEIGLRTPAGGGAISEEQSYSVLSDGSIYAVYRTIDGHPAYSYSRDGGHSWEAPEYKRFADGRLIKHPRAANFAWRCENGKYLYWFHNHGGKWYDDRNPVWVSMGEETDSPAGKVIRWSEPEILLYETDTHVRMSYPDLIYDGGRYFVTETNKNAGRVREIDKNFLDILFSQFTRREVAANGLLLESDYDDEQIKMPKLPKFIDRDNSLPDFGTKKLAGAVTVELCINPMEKTESAVLLDSRAADGSGILIELMADNSIDSNGIISIEFSDGRTTNRWQSDIMPLFDGERHHAGIVLDGGPCVISFVTDGRQNDGGETRQFGWGRFSPDMYSVNGGIYAYKSPLAARLRIYGRALMTTEIIGNSRLFLT